MKKMHLANLEEMTATETERNRKYSEKSVMTIIEEMKIYSKENQWLMK